MTSARVTAAAALAVVIAGLTWIMFIGLPRWSDRSSSVDGAATQGAASSASVRRIKARLFYVAPDGLHLTGVDQDVPYGDNTVEQAKALVVAEVAPARTPLLSAFPSGTTLRSLFVTARGEAFVDLSAEVSTGHPGGSRGELLTVYALVDTLTTNLPAITSVQLLVGGKEVETLAGHVDLRRPLAKNLAWVQ